MAAKGAYAKDGTPRSKAPQKDADGNWYCPVCGRASGFRNNMAVLAHMKACRPGKPAISELVGEPPRSSSSLYVPTASETAQFNGMAAIMARLDQMAAVQANHSKIFGNHLQHQSLAAAKTPPPSPAPSSFSMTDMVKWGAVALGTIAVAQQLSAPAPRVIAVAPLSEGAQRIKKIADDAKAKKCAAQWQARAEGHDVEIEEECLAPEERAKPKRKAAAGKALGLGHIAGLVKDVAAISSSFKKLV
jgi:hypothetical protein